MNPAIQSGVSPTYNPGVSTEHMTQSGSFPWKPGYLSIEAAAQYASVSTKTVQRWIKAGLPVYQGMTRGKVLVRPSDIDVYLTRRQARQIDLDALVNDALRGLQGQAA